MKEFTLERSPMDVRNVRKSLLMHVTYIIMKELIVEKNCGCAQCGKAFAQAIHL
jgi:hypothetical protein